MCYTSLDPFVGSPTKTESLEGLLPTESWVDLCVQPEELRPAYSLTNGQCFNWRKAGADCWVGVLGREVIAIRCDLPGKLEGSFIGSIDSCML